MSKDIPPPLAKAPFDAAQAKAHQAAWAKHLGTAVETTNTLGAKMVLIAPGEFFMGSTAEQNAAAVKMAEDSKVNPEDVIWSRLKSELPRHRITWTNPYLLGMTEVTNGEFEKFVKATNYVTDAERFGFGSSGSTAEDDKVKPETQNLNWRNPGYSVTDDLPATQISWNDAAMFCNWLSDREGFKTCYRQSTDQGWILLASANGYRLPTEAEWEYACRAGTTTQYSFGEDTANTVGARLRATVRRRWPARLGRPQWWRRLEIRKWGLDLPNR